MQHRHRALPCLLSVLLAPLCFHTTGRADGETATTEAVAYQIGPEHAGAATVPGLQFPLGRQWTRRFDSGVHYPLIADGRVFLTIGDTFGGTGQLAALDVRDGRALWSRAVNPAEIPQLTYSEGLILTSGGGELAAFDGATGDFRWSRRFPGDRPKVSGPIARGGVTYINTLVHTNPGYIGTVYAVRSSDGEVLWSTATPSVGTAPVVGAEGVFSALSDYSVARLQVESGTVVWEHQGTASASTGMLPVLAGGRYYARDPNRGSILDGATGNLLGTFPDGPAPAFSSGRMYFISNGILYARDAASQTALWSRKGAYDFVLAPVAINDRVVTVDIACNVCAFEGATGEPVWTDPLDVGIVSRIYNDDSGEVPGFAACTQGCVLCINNTVVAYGPRKETAPPLTNVTVTGTPGKNGWYLRGVDVELTAFDASGVAATYYQLDQEPVQKSQTPVRIPIWASGTHVFRAWSVDTQANAEEPRSLNLKVDSSLPGVLLGVRPEILSRRGPRLKELTLSGRVGDEGSGIDSRQTIYSVRDSAGKVQPHGRLPLGRDGSFRLKLKLDTRFPAGMPGRIYEIRVRTQDRAGHRAEDVRIVIVR